MEFTNQQIKQHFPFKCTKVAFENINDLDALQVTGGDIVTSVKEVLGGGSAEKVVTSVSTSSGGTGQSSSSSSSTATGGGDTYGEETNSYDNYDTYGNYETYYDETTASPDVDISRRVTVTSTGTGGKLDLGLGGKIDLGAGTGGTVITSGGGSSITISSNKTSVGWQQ